MRVKKRNVRGSKKKWNGIIGWIILVKRERRWGGGREKKRKKRKK